MAATGPANIIRKIEVVEGGGHHGGAWKVAYADFMTAMMAFFLLMWILSSSDEKKLAGIAEYFTNATMPGGAGVLDGATLGPPGTLSASNGAVVARGSQLGKIDSPSPAQWEVRDTTPTVDPQQRVLGSMKGNNENPAGGAAAKIYQPEIVADGEGNRSGAGKADKSVKADAADTTDPAGATPETPKPQHSADNARFNDLQTAIMQAMQENPDLRPLQKNVIFEPSSKGLRIQIIDQQGKPMFASGSAKMRDATLVLLENLGQSLAKLPNDLVITGHTDSVPFINHKTYDNWDLSSDRANAMRRVLTQSGVSADRIIRVSGKANTEPLVPDAPNDPSNRRITVLLQYRPETADSAQAAPATSVQKTEAAAPETAPKKIQQADNSPSPLDETAFQTLRSVLR